MDRDVDSMQPNVFDQVLGLLHSGVRRDIFFGVATEELRGVVAVEYSTLRAQLMK